MSRTAKSITVTETFEVKAKSLKKGDSIWIAKRVYTVKSNEKNDLGKRVITLQWGSRNEKDEVTLVIRGKALFSVRNSKYTRI